MQGPKKSFNPGRRYSNSSDGRYIGNLPDPQNFGVISDGIAYPEFPAVGSQDAANGGVKGPASIGASMGPQITPGDRASSISRPISGPGHLPKHGRG